jgi:hypothetical protein
VHYPSSKLTFDDLAFTPIMVDGKVRHGSAKSLSKLRQHCSSRAHPCDCNDVSRVTPGGGRCYDFQKFFRREKLEDKMAQNAAF